MDCRCGAGPTLGCFHAEQRSTRLRARHGNSFARCLFGERTVGVSQHSRATDDRTASAPGGGGAVVRDVSPDVPEDRFGPPCPRRSRGVRALYRAVPAGVRRPVGERSAPRAPERFEGCRPGSRRVHHRVLRQALGLQPPHPIEHPAGPAQVLDGSVLANAAVADHDDPIKVRQRRKPMRDGWINSRPILQVQTGSRPMRWRERLLPGSELN